MKRRKPGNRRDQGRGRRRAVARPRNIERARKLLEAAVNPAARPRVPRNPDGTFQRGASGNPSGRPKEFKDFVDLAREVGSSAAFEALVWEIEHGDFEPAVVKSAEVMLAYAWGRPKQAVELTGKDGGPVEVTDARERILARIAARLGAGSQGGSPPEPDGRGS